MILLYIIALNLPDMDRIIKKKKWTPKKIVSIGISILFVVFVFYLVFLRDTSSRLYTDKDRMTIAVVENGRFQEFIPVDGNVQPLVTIYLDAVFGGRVEEIFVRDGAIVEEGDKNPPIQGKSKEVSNNIDFDS